MHFGTKPIQKKQYFVVMLFDSQSLCNRVAILLMMVILLLKNQKCYNMVPILHVNPLIPYEYLCCENFQARHCWFKPSFCRFKPVHIFWVAKTDFCRK